jgi:RND family efflux transporter MFP subunit
MQRCPFAPGHAVPAALGLAATVVMPLVGCGQASPELRITPVQTDTVRQQEWNESLSAVASLEADQEVQLAAQAGGRIERLLVAQGDRVRRGQLLLVLDQTQLRAEVASLRAQMETRKLNFQRFQQLVRQGAASALQRDEFREAYIAAREALVAREADLAFKDLRAPIDGVVGELAVKAGDVIQPGQVLTRLLRNDRLEARIDVPAVAAARVRPGQRVFLFEGLGDRPIATGLVSSLDPAVSSASQVIAVRARVQPTGTAPLRSGQRSRARIALDGQEALMVPFTAVSRLAGQSFVSVVGTLADLERSPGQVRLGPLRRLPPGTRFAIQTPVQLGPLQNNRYPVLRGLEPGAQVITSGGLNIRHGSPVKPESIR